MSQPLVIPDGRQGPGPMPEPAVATLDLAFQRRVGGQLPGDHRGMGVGAGMELAQLRPYEPGDDLRQLDASASARTAIAHVRQQVPERSVTTWVVLDLSPSMAFGTARRLKSDVAEGVSTVIARLAVRRGGRIAVATCGVPDPKLLPPRGGRRALAGVQRLASAGVAPDGFVDPHALEYALLRIRRLAVQAGMIVVVSDFRGGGAWQRPLSAIAGRHSVIAVEVVDPREAALPDAGHLVLVDPETGAQVEADTASERLRERFAAAEAQRRTDLAEHLRRAGVQHVPLSTDGDWLRDLARRFR